VDDHKDSELRALLGPLAELAARRHCTIILVKHFTKGATAKAVHKVSGSAGYVNSVRAAFIIVPDAEDEQKKLFLPIKFNIGPKPSGLAYRLQPLSAEERGQVLAPFVSDLRPEDMARLGEQLCRIGWEGPVATDADTALGDAAKKDRGPNKVEQAAAWVKEFLAVCAYPSDEILAAGKDAGFTFDNIRGQGPAEGRGAAQQQQGPVPG
jgi:putative DNA primase/helicase